MRRRVSNLKRLKLDWGVGETELSGGRVRAGVEKRLPARRLPHLDR